MTDVSTSLAPPFHFHRAHNGPEVTTASFPGLVDMTCRFCASSKAEVSNDGGGGGALNDGTTSCSIGVPARSLV